MKLMKLMILLLLVSAWGLSFSLAQTSGGGPTTHGPTLEISDVTGNIYGFPYKLLVSSGTLINNNDGTMTLNTGGTGTVTGTGTTNQIAYWTGTTSIGGLDTGTYPSLTELSYVKGVTSSIQTQFSSYAKLDGTNQPFTGDLNISKVSPISKLSDTSSGNYGYLTRVATQNGLILYNQSNATLGGYALLFASGSSQYGHNDDSSTWNLGSGDFTMSLWVKFTSLPTNGNEMSFLTHFNANQHKWIFHVYNNAGTYQIQTGDYQNFFDYFNCSPNLTTGVWYNFVWRRSGNTFNVYQAASSIGSSTHAVTFETITGNLNFAQEGSPNNRYLDGTMDEIGIWNRALTTGEISTLYNLGSGYYITTASGPGNTNLLGLWHFDENTGTSAADSSGNNHTVTLVNTPSWVSGIVNQPTGVQITQVIKSIDGANVGEYGKHYFGDPNGTTYLNGTSIISNGPLTLASGSTTVTPLTFTSGSLNTSPVIGAEEFLTDKYYGVISTGTARKEITLNDAALTSGIVPAATTNGRLHDNSGGTTETELGYVHNVTSAIQTQLNAKGAGTVTSVGVSSASGTLTIGSSPITTSGTITANINLANANTWTATQTFNPSGFGSAAINSTPANGTSGGNAGGWTFTPGGGGAGSSSNGGFASIFTIGSASGGQANGAHIGGSGSSVVISLGSGGQSDSSSSGSTGGNAGGLTVNGGTGGNGTGNGTSIANGGGTGSAMTFNGGNAGNGSQGSTPGNGGVGGSWIDTQGAGGQGGIGSSSGGTGGAGGPGGSSSSTSGTGGAGGQGSGGGNTQGGPGGAGGNKNYTTGNGGGGGSSIGSAANSNGGKAGDFIFQTGTGGSAGTGGGGAAGSAGANGNISLEASSGQVGIGVTAGGTSALLTLGAGSATAKTAPLKLTSGTLMTTAEIGAQEYNGNYYLTNGGPVRFPVGGTIFDHYADVGNNSGTGETDLYSDTTIANTLKVNGDKITAQYGGIFANLLTATVELRVYFGGTKIYDSGTATLGADVGWNVSTVVQRDTSTTVRCTTILTTTGASSATYAQYTRVTGLTLSSTNILKITGQSAGTGNATNDIVAKQGYVEFKPAN